MKGSMINSRVIAFTVWMIASVFYAYQYILRVLPNIMMSDIMQQYDISAATFGQFSGVYYIGYSLMHIPIGIMLDRYGPKKVMTVCILFNVIGLMPLVFSEYWIYPIFGRVLIGMGSSAAILGAFKVIRMIFSEKRFPRMLSISVTIGLIGAIYGGGPVDYMRQAFGYQVVIQVMAIVGVLLAVSTYLIVPDVKADSETTVGSDIKEVLTNKKVIWTCIFAGLMVGPLEGFADVWGTTFLKQAYGFEATIAASMPSMIFIGMCFGSPVLSYMADKVGSYLATIVFAGAVMTAIFISILAFNLTPSIMSVGFLAVGVCSAYQILAIYKASTYVNAHLAGLSTAVANMIIMTFGYLFHSVIGTLVGMMGGPETKMALMVGTAVIPIALIGGTAGYSVIFVRERAHQRKMQTVRDLG